MLVNKPGTDKLRICMDPSALNKSIQREHYQIKTAEEIFANLAGSKYFSTLDDTSGFLQVVVDEDSSYLTTIATPFRRYRYLRLPFWISSVPEVFHRIVTEDFSDIPDVPTYVDSFVSGTTREKHDERLKMVIQRCRELNFKLNRGKCQFGQKELPDLGHILTTKGIQPDPAKIEAIHRFPQPKTKADVSRLLGMVAYLAKFCPDLAEIAKPLRHLTQKDVSWTWDAIQDDSVTLLKKLVSHKLTSLRPKTPNHRHSRRLILWIGCRTNTRLAPSGVCIKKHDQHTAKICPGGKRNASRTVWSREISPIHLRTNHHSRDRPQTLIGHNKKTP